VLDGSDNFATRYVVNDACVLKGIPLVFGSVFQYDGQLAVFNYLRPDGSRGPNYRDLFPEPPPYGSVPDCAEGGVLGVLPGIIGTMQALEAIKLITGLGDLLDGKILTFDALSFQTKTLSYSCDPNNPLTGIRPMQTELIDYDLFCGVPRNISTILRNEIPTLEPCDWDRWRNVHTQFVLIDVREEKEYYRESMNGQLIPLGEIPHRISEIDFSLPILVHCQSGKRSEQAVKQLIQLRPEAQIWNLAGGIIAWYHLRSELVNWDSGS